MTATEYNSPEYVILVDKNDQEIGSAEKLAAHAQNLLHRAFSVFIFRECAQKELLLQQRAFEKYHSGGLWTNTCCSHPRLGESILAAGRRRLQEEIGIIAELKNLGWFHYNAHFENGLAENEIDHVLVGCIPADTVFTFNPLEVHTYRWINLTDLETELATYPERFTPWFKEALEIAVR